MMPPKTVAILDTLINEMAAALIEGAADLHDEHITANPPTHSGETK